MLDSKSNFISFLQPIFLLDPIFSRFLFVRGLLVAVRTRLSIISSSGDRPPLQQVINYKNLATVITNSLSNILKISEIDNA